MLPLAKANLSKADLRGADLINANNVLRKHEFIFVFLKGKMCQISQSLKKREVADLTSRKVKGRQSLPYGKTPFTLKFKIHSCQIS